MPSPIAFIIPALNEEAAIAPMLDGLRAALDAAACADADIVVVDNGSRDALERRQMRDTNFGWTIEM
jgi:glycosyltransferase involved in cell wall biosynthesis